ncbi:MAG: TonB-dependent receptor [Verrucomicrobiales bacterium]|nr:TonB-dependent receptor [Verrucomicrobiales bacterium]
MSPSTLRLSRVAPLSLLAALSPAVHAEPHDLTELPSMLIRGRADSLVGVAASASEGLVGVDHFESRPLQRPGELLETVPGVILTQHSGAGKANQFFLRGFNLDHGTDFATSLGGVPINLPTHAHGQGYTDLNFVIPELVETVRYRKGPYFAELGDFSSAGAADLTYASRLPQGLLQIEAGSHGYARGLVADTPGLGAGHLLYALDLSRQDGPWNRPEAYERVNAVLGYSQGDDALGFSVTGMAYSGEWNATDQIAARAPLGRFETLNPSSGGRSSRFSLQGEWHRQDDHSATRLLAYGVGYHLDLFSDFTYALASPLGDQFEQRDQRGFGGLKADHTFLGHLGERSFDTTVGLQLRGDAIETGLSQTVNRSRRDKPQDPDPLTGTVGFLPATTRADEIAQISLSPYISNRAEWTSWLRSELGLRADHYAFDVTSDDPRNSGSTDETIVSPKAALIFGPWSNTEFYLNGGLGFHSNDGRGATTTFDPSTGDPVSPVDPLVRTYGAEIGVRNTSLRGLQSSLSLWWLDVDSELLFIGDAGTTEASRPSRRYGLELANYYQATPWLTLDADVSVSHAEFRDSDPAGDRIPGSIETVVAAGLSLHDLGGFFASLRVRYFGPRPLIEDDSVRSEATVLLTARAGYQFHDRLTFSVEVFNLLNRKDADITYLYPSRLPGETPGPEDGGHPDLHFHPVEPLSARATLTYRF